MNKGQKVINKLAKRGLFFGVTYFELTGVHVYMLVGNRIRYVSLGTAKALLHEIERKEEMDAWEFGRIRA